MFIDVEVSLALDAKVYATVMGNLFEHVVKEAYAGMKHIDPAEMEVRTKNNLK